MKTGVQKLCNQLKKLDSGFHRNDKKWCFSTFYEFIKFGFPRHSYCHRSSFAFGPKYVCLTVMRLILELLRFDSCTIFRMILLKKLETMSSLRAVVSVGRRLVQDSLPVFVFSKPYQWGPVNLFCQIKPRNFRWKGGLPTPITLEPNKGKVRKIDFCKEIAQ